MNGTNHPAEPANASNIVPLVDGIVKEGEQRELDQKRAIAMRAFAISAKQLEADALRFEEAAIVGEHPIMKRHQIMDEARALRIASAWLANLSGISQEPQKADVS